MNTTRQLINTENTPEIIALLEGINEPAILLDPEYRILGANQPYRDIYPISDGKQQQCYEASHNYTVPCDQAGEVCPLKKCQESGEPHRVLHLHHTPKGEEHVDVSLFPIKNKQGDIVYFLEKMQQTKVASAQPVTEGLVGKSSVFNAMLELVHRVAPSETPALLLGESGTGKELVARAIHESSGHRDGPFVAVECAGLSESLFESELFGHEKGAFTGAQQRKIGLVESARHGTLFLDEVGDIPLSQQIKLLRLLETGTFRRVGGVDNIEADFRLILATHRNLKKQVELGEFRQDLYYRISAFPIHLPALRDRRDDLPLLIQTLLNRLAPKRKATVGKSTLECLQHYSFPGNIRELRNILERALLIADGNRLMPEHLPAECRTSSNMNEPPDGHIQTLEDHERSYLINLLRDYKGDRGSLAKELGISKRTLFRKISEL